jgi:glycosyltransferase involved in cell wall biosynthesis
MNPRISAVVNTLNEEKNLAYALRSLTTWVDEVVVVDMHSDDRTVEIAREHGARVFLHERTSAPDGARAFALSQAAGEWVILLDADELVPAPLAERLRELAREGEWDVVKLPRRNYLLGDAVDHTGWGAEQDAQLRFFRRDAILASDHIHAMFRPAEGARVLSLAPRPEHALVHFAYLDTAHFLEKLNRYTTVEAEQAFAAKRRTTPAKAFLQVLREFATRYVRMGGWRDGWRGLYLSLFMAMYRAATAAKLEELARIGGREEVRRAYGEVAEEVLSGYAFRSGDPGAKVSVSGAVSAKGAGGGE